MTKVQVAIYLDSERLQFLESIQSRYHQKNLSTSLEIVFKQYEMMADELRMYKEQKIFKRTEEGISKGLPDKYKLKQKKETQ